MFITEGRQLSLEPSKIICRKFPNISPGLMEVRKPRASEYNPPNRWGGLYSEGLCRRSPPFEIMSRYIYVNHDENKLYAKFYTHFIANNIDI